MTAERVTYVEVDIPYCSLVYGTAPCTAEVGVTGAIKCFNTKVTCQDSANYTPATVTLRWAVPALHLSQDIDAIPCVRSVAMTPGVISLGGDLGVRSTVTVTLDDFPWPDTGEGYDKYYAERTYNPFTQGSYWGKFRARQPYLRGAALRIYRGTPGQALSEMEIRHYFVEASNGPTTGGQFQIVAKDALKLADDERAKAPALSQGYLLAAITDAATSATLSPSGIGDDEYPASGYVCIGGNEVCSFTRSGDALTLTRGQLGTTASAHNGDDRVQLVLRYAAADPADIIYDLLTGYTAITSGMIPLANWQAETAAYSQNVYTATITEPTGVNSLVAELVEQAGLALWWDEIAEQIRLRVLRSIPTDATLYDSETIMEGTLQVTEQPTKRLSQVWTYYGQVDPTQALTNLDNYRSAELTVDPSAEVDNGSPQIKTITSRWIPALGRSVAARLNAIQLGRFVAPPRRVNFALLRDGNYPVELGDGLRVGGWSIQDETGAATTIPVQVTSINQEDDRSVVEAEEVLFTQYDEADLLDRVITIDSHYNDFNLRAVHDSLFPTLTDADVSAGVTLTVVVAEGVRIGATVAGTSGHAFEIGTFPSGLPIYVVINGLVQGKGGYGGDGGDNTKSPTNGQDGGTAIYTRQAIHIVLNSTGSIYGGGGGGAGAARYGTKNGGGGGAGKGNTPSAGGNATPFASPGGPSTYLTNGYAGPGEAPSGKDGGAGGGRGAAGESAEYGSATPGAAGRAIDGVSYCTFDVNDGERFGTEVN